MPVRHARSFLKHACELPSHHADTLKHACKRFVVGNQYLEHACMLPSLQAEDLRHACTNFVTRNPQSLEARLQAALTSD